MPVRKDFSGGISDRPIELLRPNELLAAENVYWNRGLKRWGGSQRVGTLSAPDVIGVHPYVKKNGDSIVLLVRAVVVSNVAAAQLWQLKGLASGTAALERIGTDHFWLSCTTDDAAYFAQMEQGIVFGTDRFWPMVCTEALDGTFSLKEIGEFDIRVRSELDWSAGWTRNVGDATRDEALQNTFLLDDVGLLYHGFDTDESVVFETFENNVLWIESLLTFNRITLTGQNLPGGARIYLVNDEGSYVEVGNGFEVNADQTEAVGEWDWDAAYGGWNTRKEPQFTQGRVGLGNYRAFVWWYGPDPRPRPIAPVDVTLSGGDGTIRVSWARVSGASGYRIRFKVRGAPDSTYSAWATTTNFYYDLNGLSNDSEYTIQLQSSSPAGISLNTTTVHGRASAEASAPGVPVVTFDGYEIVASRGDAGGAVESYDIEYREGVLGGWIRVNNVENGRITTTIEGVVQARALARSTAGSSEFSDPVTRVAKPLGVVVTAGDTRLNVDGGQVHGATDYDYAHRATSEDSWTEETDTAIPSHRFSIDGLVNGRIYLVRTRARNANGPGPWSDALYGVPLTPTAAPTGTPTAVLQKITPDSIYVNNQNPVRSVLLTVGPVAGALRFHVEIRTNVKGWYSPSVSGESEIGVISTSGTHTIRDVEMSDGGWVEARVAAVNSAGAGAFRTAARITYSRLLITASATVRANAGGEVEITFSAATWAHIQAHVESRSSGLLRLGYRSRVGRNSYFNSYASSLQNPQVEYPFGDPGDRAEIGLRFVYSADRSVGGAWSTYFVTLRE